MRFLKNYHVSKAALAIFFAGLVIFSAISESTNQKTSTHSHLLAGAGVVSVAAVASIIYFYSKKGQAVKEVKTAQSREIKQERKSSAKKTKTEVDEKVAIVIDFDRCLMKDNFCYPHRITPIDQVNISEKDFGLTSPRESLNSLLDNDRVRFAIASFGRKDIINKALDHVIDKEHRDKIIVKTPQDVGGQDWYWPNPANKNKMLEQIAQETGVPFRRMILFDDTKKNLYDAEKLGVTARHAEPFDENSLNIAKRFIR